MSGDVNSNVDLENIDELWDYSNPKGTREKFLKTLEEMGAAAPLESVLEIKTQIARTHSLGGEFEESHQVLDEVETRLAPEMALVKTRLQLERGRAFNSAKEKDKAIACFHESLENAKAHQQDFYAVDAAHMLAISAPSFDEKVKWAHEGIRLAEESALPRARRWLGSLYNNLGWDYHDAKKFEEALGLFEKAKAYHQEFGNSESRFIARWTVARCLRSLERFTEATEAQQQLMAEMEKLSNPDGFVFEELAELSLVEGAQEKAQAYAQKAVEQLKSQAAWLQEWEPERWKRLEELAAAEG